MKSHILSHLMISRLKCEACGALRVTSSIYQRRAKEGVDAIEKGTRGVERVRGNALGDLMVNKPVHEQLMLSLPICVKSYWPLSLSLSLNRCRCETDTPTSK